MATEAQLANLAKARKVAARNRRAKQRDAEARSARARKAARKRHRTTATRGGSAAGLFAVLRENQRKLSRLDRYRAGCVKLEATTLAKLRALANKYLT